MGQRVFAVAYCSSIRKGFHTQATHRKHSRVVAASLRSVPFVTTKSKGQYSCRNEAELASRTQVASSNAVSAWELGLDSQWVFAVLTAAASRQASRRATLSVGLFLTTMAHTSSWTGVRTRACVVAT